jgi:Uma2 family endonuclease
MATVLDRAEERLILHNVSWVTYEHLLSDFLDSSAPRFTYDQGTLEIMSPLAEHEEANRSLNLLVEMVAAVYRVRLRNLGSTTFKREDQERGFEPDSSFYVQNVERIRGRTRIDLTVDPPPDLVIEIDITHSSLNKLPIYAAFGVPEVWRYEGERLRILILEAGSYQEADHSMALPVLSATAISRLIEESKTMERFEWVQWVQDWARQQLQTEGPH